MPFDFLEAIGKTLDILDIFADAGSVLQSDGYKSEKSKKNKKTKYLVEKTSAVFLILAAGFLFFVLKDPLPSQNLTQTIFVIVLIGLAVSGLFFFVLHVLELYYFKSLWQLLLFSCSSFLLITSVLACIYFKWIIV